MDLDDPMEFKLDLTRTEANVLNARSIAVLKRFPPLLRRVIRDGGRFVDRGSLAIIRVDEHSSSRIPRYQRSFVTICRSGIHLVRLSNIDELLLRHS